MKILNILITSLKKSCFTYMSFQSNIFPVSSFSFNATRAGVKGSRAKRRKEGSHTGIPYRI